jgi:hypothetical protein
MNTVSRPTYAAPRRKAVFGAVGDIALCGATAEAMRKYGTGWPLSNVMKILNRADVLFGNLECVLLPPDYPEHLVEQRGLATKYDGTEALTEAGFDFLCLANNHILDGGTTGLQFTQSALAARALRTGGVGETQERARELQVIEKSGYTWGFLCYGEDSNYSLSTTGPCYAYYDPSLVLEDIAMARSHVDVLVVSVHADLEFCQSPSVPRRDAFRAFARAGATLILGHHPHVAQGVELLGGSLIAYSLGNFVFHSHTSEYLRPHLPHVARSFVLLAEVTPQGVERFERIPVVIHPPPEERPAPAIGAAAVEIESYLEELDAMLTNEPLLARLWRENAIRHVMRHMRIAASLDEPDAFIRALGRLVQVAENRGPFDESMSASLDAWATQRLQSDAFNRPSLNLAQPRGIRHRHGGVIEQIRSRITTLVDR